MTANSAPQGPQAEAPRASGAPGAPASTGSDSASGPVAAPGSGHGPGISPGPSPGSHHPQPVPAAVRHTRLGGLWLVFTLGAVLLVLLLVFILQNSQHVEVHIFGAHLDAPVGVALLMAAALGVLLVVVPGGGRIIQLKRAARRLHRDRERLVSQLDQATTDAPAPPAP